MNLRHYLLAKGLTHEAFGKMIGVSQAAVSRYCRGRVPRPLILTRIVYETDGEVTANDFLNTVKPTQSHLDESKPPEARPFVPQLR